MKQYFKKIIIFSMSVILLFVSCPFSAYASDHGGSGGTDHNSDFITDSGTINVKDDGVVMYYIEYILSQIGAIVKDHDLTKAMANDQTMKEYISKGKFDANENTVTFPKETVTYVYNTLINVAKEHEPYWIVPIASYRDLDPAKFKTKAQYSTICQLARTYGLIGVNGDQISDLSGAIENKHSLVMYTNWADTPDWSQEHALVCFYNEAWQWRGYYIYRFNFTSDMTVGFTSFDDGTKLDASSSRVTLHDRFFPNYPFYHNGGLYYYNTNIYGAQKACLISKDGGHMRVYKTLDDFKRYTVGNRKVYYTENYYNYVPEDLTTSIDDLQQTVDDLSGVIDKLLGQITDTTDESEIEDLLKQILDELKNNQGGGGGGSGGGDVNVDIDLSSTNTLLSKILATVTQIFDKISAGSAGTGGNILKESLDAVLAKLEDLNSMLRKYLSEITGDLDDIKGQLADMSEQEFEQKSDSFLGEVMDAFSEISEVVKTKFPFSIPNDLHIFLSKIAPALHEAEAALYLNDTSGVSLYSGEHGGGGTTDGEPNPPGGGGASRPGSSFVDVEHGGGGGSREPAEMREAPVFRLPIVIERYGIEEYIIIDMAPFDPLSRFSRSFFTMIFMVCLFNLTFKVIGMWGDIVG